MSIAYLQASDILRDLIYYFFIVVNLISPLFLSPSIGFSTSVITFRLFYINPRACYSLYARNALAVFPTSAAILILYLCSLVYLFTYLFTAVIYYRSGLFGSPCKLTTRVCSLCCGIGAAVPQPAIGVSFLAVAPMLSPLGGIKRPAAKCDGATRRV